MKSIRNDKHALGALGGAVVAIAVILVIAGAYLFVLPLIPNSTIESNTTVTVNSSQSQVSNGQYLGIQWQNVGGGTTPSAVSLIAFPQNDFGSYWNKGSLSASTQYTSPSQIFNLGNGICVQVYSTSAYTYAYCASGSNSQSISLPGFPQFHDIVNPSANCLVSSTSTPCISLTPTYPNSYANGSSSVSAVTASISLAGGGTTIPSSGSITVNLVGVAARGGGVGMDQCVNTQVLATGLTGQAMPNYNSKGAPSVATAGSILPSNCEIILNTNQTAFIPSMNPITARQQVSGAQGYEMTVPNNDIFTSSATANGATPKYAFMSITIPFTYTGPTGKDIALTVSILDSQVEANTLNNAVLNSGLTGTTAACTSSTTTNMCDNASDITVGTAQYTYGMPVVFKGGGAASSTQPSWLPQQASSYPGWNTYCPLETMITATQVYGT